MIGHFSGMKLAVGADHLLYGWVFFGFIIFLLFYMGSFWRDSEEELKRVNINNEEQSLTKDKERKSFVFLGTIFLFIISLSIFANQIDNEKRKARGSVLIQLPVNFSGWQYSTNKFFNWKPISKNADATLSRAYVLDENGKNIVQLDIAYYQIQRQGAEAVSWGNRLTHPHGGEWKLTSAKDVLEGGQHFTESEIKYPGIKLLVWRWYRMGEYETPNSYIAKAYEVYNFIIKGRSDASVISIATEVKGSADMARQKLAGFWQVSANGMNNELDKIQLKQEQIEQKQIEKKSEQ
jgi:EpsI family protein